MKGCEKTAERLAAWVDGGLSDAEAAGVEHHVQGCASCAAEAHVLRQVLADLRTPPPRRDEAFWLDLERSVHSACSQAVPDERALAVARGAGIATLLRNIRAAGLSRPGLAVMACAIVLIVVVAWAPWRHAPVLHAPAIQNPAPRPMALPVFEDLEDLDEVALDAVLAAFADEEDDDMAEEDPDIAITAHEWDPYDAVSSLSDKQLERVESALAKGG